MNTLEVLRDARKHGGGTYLVTGYDINGWHLDRAVADHGFWVSREYGMENVPDLVMTRDVLHNFITARNVDQHWLGLWRDEIGLWSVDVTDWTASREHALHLAKLGNQRAIWDIVDNSAFYVD